MHRWMWIDVYIYWDISTELVGNDLYQYPYQCLDASTLPVRSGEPGTERHLVISIDCLVAEQISGALIKKREPEGSSSSSSNNNPTNNNNNDEISMANQEPRCDRIKCNSSSMPPINAPINPLFTTASPNNPSNPIKAKPLSNRPASIPREFIMPQLHNLNILVHEPRL